MHERGALISGGAPQWPQRDQGVGSAWPDIHRSGYMLRATGVWRAAHESAPGRRITYDAPEVLPLHFVAGWWWEGEFRLGSRALFLLPISIGSYGVFRGTAQYSLDLISALTRHRTALFGLVPSAVPSQGRGRAETRGPGRLQVLCGCGLHALHARWPRETAKRCRLDGPICTVVPRGFLVSVRKCKFRLLV